MFNNTPKYPSERRPHSPFQFTLALRENCLSALRALTQNWLRSALTLTGIVIGVLSVVTLVAILQGVKREIGRQVEGLGANFAVVVPSKLDENGQPNPAAMIGVSTLTEQDVDALRRVPGVEAVSPVYIVSGTVDYGQGKQAREASAFVVATNREGVRMNPTPLEAGRYFSDTEEHVCILSYKPRQELFGDVSPLGKTVRIADKDWKVVGVLSRPQADGTLGNALLGLSTFVYLPVNTVRREIPGGQVNRIALRTDYRHPPDAMIEAMKRSLLVTHNQHEDFGILTARGALAVVVKLLTMAQSLLVLIAAISLFVAGIGIMNIMLVTVTERTREVGIRKTVGARRLDIFLQFLIEAIILSLLGGGIGLGLSQLVCYGIARFSPLTPLITLQDVLMALGVSIGVGLVFGVTPALRAARLNPIDALRHE